jgi:hypothetical protein
MATTGVRPGSPKRARTAVFAEAVPAFRGSSAILEGRSLRAALDAPREDRSAIAGTLFECFERYEAERTDQSPDGIHKEAS